MEISSESFVFSAQQTPDCDMNVDLSKGIRGTSSAKRAKAVHDVHGHNDIDDNHVRKEDVRSFKSKLLSMSTPNSWSGTDNTREKLQIDPKDIVISKGPNDLMMKLSPELKEKLHKP